jgi:hypothetical protein
MVIIRCGCRGEHGKERPRTCRISEIKLDAKAGHLWVVLDNGDERLMYLTPDQMLTMELELH